MIRDNSVIVTIDELRRVLKYRPADGALIWNSRPKSEFKSWRSCAVWNAKNAGELALHSVTNNGYRAGTYKKRHWLAHLVIWAIHYGEWPSGQIDHINRNRLDNRLENLRVVTQSQNMANRAANRSNPTGLKGVSQNKGDGKFKASIRKDNKQYCLGTFNTADEAHEAYRKAALELHGEYARFA